MFNTVSQESLALSYSHSVNVIKLSNALFNVSFASICNFKEK